MTAPPSKRAPKTLVGSGAEARRLLVCFSHLRWDFVRQRPQHLLSRAARSDLVLFVEEPIFRPGIVPRWDLTRRPEGVTVAVPVLPEGMAGPAIVEVQRHLLSALLLEQRPASRLFWYYTPMAFAFSNHLACDLCVYDNMDELSAFRGASPELLALETALLARADVVFTGGMSLYEAKSGRHPNLHAFPSSIDAGHFGRARGGALADPADQAALPHPRLGYFAVIDERMDVDLVEAVAGLRPDWHLVVIGPVVKIDPAMLPKRGNIHWLGPKSYDELPAYLAHWDLGLMPFALNEATRFISPTKTPEFLAAGLPVISTPIQDVIRPYGDLGLVEIARTAEEVVTKAEALLARPRGEWLARVDRHLAAGSWDRTWTAMRALINQAEQARAEGPASYSIAAAE